MGIVIQYRSNSERIVYLDSFITFIAPRLSDSVTYPTWPGLRVQMLSTNNLSLENIAKVQMRNLTQKLSRFPNYTYLPTIEDMIKSFKFVNDKESNQCHKLISTKQNLRYMLVNFLRESSLNIEYHSCSTYYRVLRG